MATEWQVWATPLGKRKPIFFAAYEIERWQWAEKLAAFLTDKGHQDVEVREVEEDDDEEEDDD
jgi:hypothetical protein